jgi:cell wall assembly regulator SMI1
VLREAVPDALIELNEPAADAQPAEFESRLGLPVDADTSSRSQIPLEISLAPLKDILRLHQKWNRLEKGVLDPAPSPPAFSTLAHQDPLASLLDPQVLQSRLQVLREAAPDARIELNEPATDAQFAEFESRLGLPVPETFRLLYRTFNGCQYDADKSIRSQIYLGISLAPLEDILRLHQEWNRLEKEAFSQRFRPGEYWNAGWIPFLEMEGWGLGVIDTAGCFGSPPGQIIQFNYKAGAERDITYVSFDAWLLLLIEQLERATFFQNRHALPPRHRLSLSELAAHLNPGHPRRVVLKPVIPPVHAS